MDTNEIQGKKCSVKCNCGDNKYEKWWWAILILLVVVFVTNIIYSIYNRRLTEVYCGFKEYQCDFTYQLEDTGEVK